MFAYNPFVVKER